MPLLNTFNGFVFSFICTSMQGLHCPGHHDASGVVIVTCPPFSPGQAAFTISFQAARPGVLVRIAQLVYCHHIDVTLFCDSAAETYVLGEAMNGDAANRQVLCDMARSAFEVVNRLLARDQLLARELRSDATTSRQIYREECITVEMAATLRERFPEHVEITLFTPPEEARTGADWYWRFEKGDRAIHARVQAKRVQRTEFGQEDGDGHVNIDLGQLDELLQETIAAENQLPDLQAWLATFARFQATPPCGNNDLSVCTRHQHANACADHEPSLWIAQASEMRNLDDTRLPVKIVVENSVRLDCILPCIEGPNSADGPSIKGFSLNLGLPSFRDCVALIQGTALSKRFEGAMCISVVP